MEDYQIVAIIACIISAIAILINGLLWYKRIKKNKKKKENLYVLRGLDYPPY